MQQKDGWVGLTWICTSKEKVIEWSTLTEERQSLVRIAWDEQPSYSSCSGLFHSTSIKCLHNPNREKHSSCSGLPMLLDYIYTFQDFWVISVCSLVLGGKVWWLLFCVCWCCFSSHFSHNNSSAKWVGLKEHNWPKVTQMVYHAYGRTSLITYLLFYSEEGRVLFLLAYCIKLTINVHTPWLIAKKILWSQSIVVCKANCGLV